MTEPSTNDTDRAVTAKQPIISNYGLVLTVYILYLVGFLTGITVLIGVIIAYLRRMKPIQYVNLISNFRSQHFGSDYFIFLWGF